MHFGGRNWRFTNTNLRTDKLKFPAQSKVISRLLGERSRLPFVEGGEGCHPDSLEDEAEADATGLLGYYGATAAEPEWESRGSSGTARTRGRTSGSSSGADLLTAATRGRCWAI
jgi:hypothetical protein